MRIEIHGQAWNRGFYDGQQGKPLSPAPTHWEPRRARPGSAATSRVKPPGMGTRLPDPVIGKKTRPAAEPYAVPLRSTALGSAAELPPEGGVNIGRR